MCTFLNSGVLSNRTRWHACRSVIDARDGDGYDIDEINKKCADWVVSMDEFQGRTGTTAYMHMLYCGELGESMQLLGDLSKWSTRKLETRHWLRFIDKMFATSKRTGTVNGMVKQLMDCALFEEACDCWAADHPQAQVPLPAATKRHCANLANKRAVADA